MMSNISANLYDFKPDSSIQKMEVACKKYIFWMKYLPRDFSVITVAVVKVQAASFAYIKLSVAIRDRTVRRPVHQLFSGSIVSLNVLNLESES